MQPSAGETQRKGLEEDQQTGQEGQLSSGLSPRLNGGSRGEDEQLLSSPA